jgi:hypothetical protein
LDFLNQRVEFVIPTTKGEQRVWVPVTDVVVAADAWQAIQVFEVVGLPGASAMLAAPRPVKDSQIPREYQVEDLTGDSDAPPTAEEHAQQMRQMAHSDASVTGQVPEGFVPTSAMNGRPSSGMKTDSAMVKRI